MRLYMFLLFQEMRNAGTTPTVASCNLLLCVYAFCSAVVKVQDMVRRMDVDVIETKNHVS